MISHMSGPLVDNMALIAAYSGALMFELESEEYLNKTPRFRFSSLGISGAFIRCSHDLSSSRNQRHLMIPLSLDSLGHRIVVELVTYR